VAECVLYVYVCVCAISHAHDPLAYHAAFMEVRVRG